MKYELKYKLREYSPHWVSLVAKEAGVSANQVRSVFNGNHRDKLGILKSARKLLNTVGEP